MISIGKFAHLGGVSVRMLRHYDALGLLPPTAVDPASSYRSYSEQQLQRLHRITALTSLGLTLRQVRDVIDDQVPASDLAGVLDQRRTELQAQITADTARLSSVESRLLAVRAGAVATHDTKAMPFTLRSLEALRLAQLSIVADIAAPADPPEVDGLLARVGQQLQQARVVRTGPPTVHTRPLGAGKLQVSAGLPVDDDAVLPHGVEDGRLPAISMAACLVIVGAGEASEADMRTLAWWLHDNGYQHRYEEPSREVHLQHHPEDPARSVVELQMALGPAA